MRALAIFLYFLATLLSTSQSRTLNAELNPIRLLRPHSGVGGLHVEPYDCLSWRLAVETNNRRSWKVVPEKCVKYVGDYMLGGQYERDCKEVENDAVEYAQSFEGAVGENDIWVFDIDETTLSNLEYYARNDVQFGAIKYNSAKFDEWVLEAKSEPVPGMLNLYNTLRELGFKIVFLTGKREGVREAREANLKRVGYHEWLEVILKDANAPRMSSVEFKSKKRQKLVVEEGYRIVGNVGDQWSDLTGNYTGMRTFKVPNPMYYA